MKKEDHIKVIVEVVDLVGHTEIYQCINIPVYDESDDTFILPTRVGPVKIRRADMMRMKHKYAFKKL